MLAESASNSSSLPGSVASAPISDCRGLSAPADSASSARLHSVLSHRADANDSWYY